MGKQEANCRTRKAWSHKAASPATPPSAVKPPLARRRTQPFEPIRLHGAGWSFEGIRPEPQMTENTVECALAERETGHANSVTRRFTRPRRAKDANRPCGLHIRPRFRSFPIQPDAGWSLENPRFPKAAKHEKRAPEGARSCL